MKDGQLSRWLYKNNCFLTKNSKDDITHLCLDGGKLSIPNNLIPNFFELYQKGIKNNEKYFLCETPTQVSKMFCDFDFLEDHEIKIEKLKEIVQILHNTIEEYYGDSFPIILCVSPSKEVTKNKKKLIKTGVHLIWKELTVTLDQAYDISKLFIDKLNTHDNSYKWKDIIDEQVYTSGLRMIDSLKVSKKRKKNEEGKMEVINVEENRAYKPVWIYPEEEIKDNMMNECSIKTYFNEEPLFPLLDIPHHERKKTKRTNKKNNKVETNIHNDNILDRVEQFIRQQTIKEWDQPLKSLKKQNNFYIAKSDSGFCLNIMREHNSAGIYFYITESGLAQRCFCKCNTIEGRKSGEVCSKFKSKNFPLPIEVRKMLFPNSKKKTITSKKIATSSSKIDVFSSNLLLKNKNTRKEYLRMSMKTILEIEKKCR